VVSGAKLKASRALKGLAREHYPHPEPIAQAFRFDHRGWPDHLLAWLRLIAQNVLQTEASFLLKDLDDRLSIGVDITTTEGSRVEDACRFTAPVFA
jgi:hypothetical protein